MEEYTRDASGSYLREDSCYFFRIDEKTLFWQNAKIGFIYSLKRFLEKGIAFLFLYIIILAFLCQDKIDRKTIDVHEKMY